MGGGVHCCWKKRKKERERKESGEKRENSAAHCWRWKKVGLCLIALGFRSIGPHNPRCFFFLSFSLKFCFPPPHLLVLLQSVPLVESFQYLAGSRAGRYRAPLPARSLRLYTEQKTVCVRVCACVCVVEAEKETQARPFLSNFYFSYRPHHSAA